jgi:hypothetical protein
VNPRYASLLLLSIGFSYDEGEVQLARQTASMIRMRKEAQQ